MEEYIFTFGFGQRYQNCFVAIEAESSSKARRIMVKHFYNKWAFQYDSREKAGVERFNLIELKLEDIDNDVNNLKGNEDDQSKDI